MRARLIQMLTRTPPSRLAGSILMVSTQSRPSPYPARVDGQQRPRRQRLAAAHRQQRPAQGQVPEPLVQEGRMEPGLVQILDRPVGRVDLERPGQVGGPAEQLLVEPVAQPADGLGQGQAGHHRVDHPTGREAESAGRPHPHGDAGRHPAGDAEAALPDLEHLNPAVVLELLPVGDHVVGPGPDQAGRDGPHRDPADVLGVAAVAGPPPPGQQHCGHHPQRDHQPVHPQVQRAEFEAEEVQRAELEAFEAGAGNRRQQSPGHRDPPASKPSVTGVIRPALLGRPQPGRGRARSPRPGGPAPGPAGWRRKSEPARPGRPLTREPGRRRPGRPRRW